MAVFANRLNRPSEGFQELAPLAHLQQGLPFEDLPGHVTERAVNLEDQVFSLQRGNVTGCTDLT